MSLPVALLEFFDESLDFWCRYRQHFLLLCAIFTALFTRPIIHARPMEFAETYLQHFSIIFARPIELSSAAQLPQVRVLGARGLPGRTDILMNLPSGIFTLST